MKTTILLGSALFAVASAATVQAAVYAGTTGTQAAINTNSNLFPMGMPLATAGTTTLEATVAGGAISFAPESFQFQSNTFTGTQTVLDPDTLTSTPVTYSITTNYSPVTVPALGPYGLSQFTGSSLTWMAMDPALPLTSITVSGSYSLSAGGETVSGTFSYTGDLNSYYSSGSLTVPANGQIALSGGNNAFVVSTGGTTVSLFDETVGGVPVYLHMSSGEAIKIYGSGTSAEGTILTAVPETSALALGVLGVAGCLRRRRAA